MKPHRVQIMQVVLLEIGVLAENESDALDRAAKHGTQRHRLVLDATESIGFPPLEWAEFVEQQRAEMARRDAIVAEYDAAAERLASVGLAREAAGRKRT